MQISHARTRVDKVAPCPVAFLLRIVLIKRGGRPRNEKSVVPAGNTESHISIRYCSTVTQIACDIVLAVYIDDIMNARLL